MLSRVFSLHHVVEGGKRTIKIDPDKELDLGEDGILLRPDVPLELATGGREEREGEEDEVVYPSTWESLQGINFWYLSVFFNAIYIYIHSYGMLINSDNNASYWFI